MVTIIGSVAAVLTAACWLPQLFKTLRKGTAEDFAWPYLTMLTVGVFAWFVYGVLKSDPPIYLCNGFTGACVVIVALVKFRTRHVMIDGYEVAVSPSGHGEVALESLDGLGPALAADLKAVGINDSAALLAVGVDEASHRLSAAGLGDAEVHRASLHGALRPQSGPDPKAPGAAG